MGLSGRQLSICREWEGRCHTGALNSATCLNVPCIWGLSKHLCAVKENQTLVRCDTNSCPNKNHCTTREEMRNQHLPGGKIPHVPPLPFCPHELRAAHSLQGVPNGFLSI